jgi:hypothetical protein
MRSGAAPEANRPAGTLLGPAGRWDRYDFSIRQSVPTFSEVGKLRVAAS